MVICNSESTNTLVSVDNHNNNKTRDHVGTTSDSHQLLSYVGRLLSDEDFADMVDNLEACISSSEDGARMLDALVSANDAE